GYGRQYGHADVDDYIIYAGNQPIAEIPEDGVVFNTHSMLIEVSNINMDSSFQFSMWDHEFNSLNVKWKSIIPREFIGEIEEADIVILSSPLLRFKMRLPDDCCFAKKLSLDDFESLCRIPKP